MPRYHFNVEDGAFHGDAEGSILSDLTSAREEAVRLSGEILRDAAREFWRKERWKLTVTDDRGSTLFSLRFLAEEAALCERIANPA
jgi:hypothetical protein